MIYLIFLTEKLFLIEKFKLISILVIIIRESKVFIGSLIHYYKVWDREKERELRFSYMVITDNNKN